MKTPLLILATFACATGALAATSVNPARPMVTGRGNVEAQPAKVIVTNQTAAKPEESVKLDKFVVTGSLAPKAAVKAAAQPAPAKR